MQVVIDIPKELADALSSPGGDLSAAVKDALIVESYRTGGLSIGGVARLLGLPTRFEAEAWLGKRGVHWNYSVDELNADRETLSRLFDGKR